MDSSSSGFSATGRLVLGGFLAVLGLFALYLAAHTEAGGFYWQGLALFGLCAGGIFHLIGMEFDARDRH